MYPESNPLPQSLKQSFSEKLVEIVDEQFEVKISVEQGLLRYREQLVYEDRSREENLAAIFFDNGITEFTFRAGIEVEDVFRLLDALKQHLNSPGRERDLTTRLWESDVTGFSFETLEDVALRDYDPDFNLQVFMTREEDTDPGRRQISADEDGYHRIFLTGSDDADDGAGGVDDDASDGEYVYGAQHRDGDDSDQQNDRSFFYARVEGDDDGADLFAQEGLDAVEMRTSQAAEAMGLTDLAPSASAPAPDTALILNDEFKLSEEENIEVSRISEEDLLFDPYLSTIGLLKEMMFQEVEMNGFYETVTISEKMLNEMVSHGRLAEAGYLINFYITLDDRIRKEKPLWAERLRDAYVSAGSRDRLRYLSRALNEHEDVAAEMMQKYLDNFGWQALAGITELLGDLEHRSHREGLVAYLIRRGSENVEIVSRGIHDKRWYVVRNTVTILAQIGSDRALSLLQKALDHHEPRVRREIVIALADCPNDNALPVLRQLALDNDAEVRSLAVQTIVQRRGQPAFTAIAEVINDESFESMQLDDQRQLLNAFSILGGENALSYLNEVATKINPLGGELFTNLRNAAFEALSYNRSDKAEDLLNKLRRNWRPEIRKLAKDAAMKRLVHLQEMKQ